MPSWRLAALELRHRAFSALLVAAAVAAVVALALGARWVGDAASRETRRVQRDLGFNLRVLPREADLDRFLLRGYGDATMAESVVDRLADRRTVSYNHLVATLHQEIGLAGGPAIVTGVSATRFPSGHKKPPMQAAIRPGTVELGAAIADRLRSAVGDTIELGGEAFEVASHVAPTGGIDDLRVWMALPDAQRVSEQPGRISEVRAIDCLCLAPEDDPLSQLRSEIEAAAPETRVVLLSQIATARARQRRMTDRIAEQATPLAVLAGGVVVGSIGAYNARQRRQEFAVLRTLGRGAPTIVGLVVWRAALCAALGALLGWALAWAWSSTAVPTLFPVTGARSVPAARFADAAGAVGVAVAVSVAASIGPAAFALAQTPAAALRDQ